MKNSVIIIGAGVGGLATSIRLANKGYKVTLLERNAFAGGKLSEIKLGDYRFDVGPSLLTMPEKIVELMNLGGKGPDFEFERQDELCRYFWENGKRFVTHAHPDSFSNEAAKAFGIDSESIKLHLKHSKEKYEICEPVFLEKPFPALKTIFHQDFLRGILKMHKLNVWQTMHAENAKRLKNKELIQLFDRYATYNGSDPYRAPATLLAIPHLEYHLGAFLPLDGMYGIIRCLEKKAIQMGVDIQYNCPVSEITFQNKKITGVVSSHGIIPAEYVISNADSYFTYTQLLKGVNIPRSIQTAERSTSGFVFNWGIEGEFSALGLHNIFFTENYQNEFKYLRSGKGIFKDPSIYTFISSKKVKGDAPPGHENWFTMINVPAVSNENWDAHIDEAREIILNKISRILGDSIKNKIRAEWILNPHTIEARSSAHLGALYGPASNTRFAAFQRPANRCAELKGLFFTGGTVHPGGGIPLCLSSAKITSDYFPAL
jgi:phytoene desaturase